MKEVMLNMKNLFETGIRSGFGKKTGKNDKTPAKKIVHNKRGFTLVEILVVIVIIGLLFAIFVPRIDFASNSARETGVKSDFRAFMLATEQVMRENAGLAFVTNAAADTSTTNTNTSKVIEKLNLYLDPALQLSVASGTNKALSMQLDPWHQSYQMVTNAKKGTNNGKILFECGGKDNSIDGENDFILLTTYTDGAIKSATNGFSSNIGEIENVPASGTQANTKLDGTGSMTVK